MELAFRNESGKDLAETMSKLNSLSEGSVALSDKVKRSVLRSPVKGTVKRLLVTTVGGVVQPGKDVIEIVPLEDNLLLEAKVQPRDIAFLRPGQRSVVKFSAYDSRSTGSRRRAGAYRRRHGHRRQRATPSTLSAMRTNKSTRR